MKKKEASPKIIMIGNLKKNQIGKYVGGKFCADIHSPKVIVHTVCKCCDIAFIESKINRGFFQYEGCKKMNIKKVTNVNKIIFLK